MSRQDEIEACRRNFEWLDDEVWVGEFFGTVQGGGADGREGILFVTDYRVGVFAKEDSLLGSLGLSEDAGYCWGHSQVKALWCEWPEPWGLSDDGLFHATVTAQMVDGEEISVFLDTEELYRQEEIQAAFYQLWQHTEVLTVRDDLQSLWQKIESQQAQGAHQRLLKSVDKLLKKQPHSVHACLAGATAAESLDDYGRALQYMQRATESGGLFSTGASTGWGYGELARLAYWAHQNGEDTVGEGIDFATQAITYHDERVAHGWRGLLKLTRGDTSGAESDLDKALKASPKHAFFCLKSLELAIDLKHRKKQDRLARALKKADEVPPIWRDFADLTLTSLGGEHERVAEEALRWLENYGSDGHVILMLWQAFSDSPSAKTIATSQLPRLVNGALQGDPVTQFTLGYLRFLDGHADTANESLRAALRLISTDDQLELKSSIEALLLLCDAVGHLERARLAEAIRCAEDAFQARDDFFRGEGGFEGWAQFVWGKTLILQERYDAGRRLLNEARALEPNLWIWSEEEMNDLLLRGGLSPSQGPEALAPIQSGVPELYEVITHLESLVVNAPRLASLSDRARGLKSAFDDPPVVAVMGEYSVGKSTFINALLGRSFLPSGEGVTTGTITVLHYGAQERMRLNYFDGRTVEHEGVQTLDTAVRETGGSDDEIRKISHVDVFLNCDVLRHIQVVDTPGLNAPFPEHQAISESYLAQADAILFLFNVEAAGRSTEHTFLERIAEHRRKAVAIVNQIDQADPDEVEEVMDHLQDTYAETFSAIHGVSGLQALRGQETNRPELTKRSRMPQLKTWLDRELLEKAREVKRDGSKQQVQALLDDIKETQRKFEVQFKSSRDDVNTLEETLIQWMDGRLSNQIGQAVNACGKQVRSLCKPLAAGLVDNHKNFGTHPVAQTQTLAHTFRVDLLNAVGGQIEALAAEYDNSMEAWSVLARSMDGSDWSEIFRRDSARMELHSASWKKDLTDYAEKLEAYIDGFIQARGIWTIAWADLEETKAHKKRHVEVTLKDRLDEITAVFERSLSRWQRELRDNIQEQVSILQRALRREANDIREGVFNPLLRLENTLRRSR